MNIYSKDLRIRALAAVDRGSQVRRSWRTFCISLSTLDRWLKMSREGKDLARGLYGMERRILATPGKGRLLWSSSRNDDATLERHCELWEHKTGVRVSISAMSRAIREKLGWSYKKRRWVPPSETKRQEVLSESA